MCSEGKEKKGVSPLEPSPPVGQRRKGSILVDGVLVAPVCPEPGVASGTDPCSVSVCGMSGVTWNGAEEKTRTEAEGLLETVEIW